MFAKLRKRYVFAIMGFFATMLGYMMRLSLDLTILNMNTQTVTEVLPLYDAYSCPEFIVNLNRSENVTTKTIQRPFDWDTQTENSVVSAFTSAFFVTQLLGGMIAEKRGGKILMGICFVALSLCTAVIPFATKLIGSTALYVLRFISGLASGPIIPVLMAMMSKWVPVEERAFIGSIIFPGSIIGNVVGSYLAKLIMFTVGWEAVYYTFGVMGLIFCIIWKMLVFTTPNRHPTISESEKTYLNENVTSFIRTTKYDLDPIPFKALLRSGAFWGTVAGCVGRQWAFFIFTIQVPNFMKDVLHLDITFTPYLQFMPFVCMWLAALLFGLVCDNIVTKGYCSVKNARRIFTGIAASGASLSIILIMYSGCRPVLTIFWMFIGMIALGAYYSGCIIGALDFAPNYAGTMIALIDTISINSAGLIPQLNALIITDAFLQQWRISFWIVTITLILSVALYVYFVQAEEQWWDDVRRHGYPENWKYGLLACEGFIDENRKSIYVAKKELLHDETKQTTDI